MDSRQDRPPSPFRNRALRPPRPIRRPAVKTFLDYPQARSSHRPLIMVAGEICKRPTAWAKAKHAAHHAILAGSLLARAAAWASDPAGGITEKPLAPHPFPRGKTMFVQLPPEQTGVRTENRYNDPRMWGDLYEEFITSSIGTGVARSEEHTSELQSPMYLV